jgi:NADPH:quinone reductase-like Zn-dependent oxidoreductase
MRAVQFDQYGDLDVLEVREVDDPVAAAGRVVVRVRAAALNPGENFIRSGAAARLWPTTFPSGQGSDLAGEVVAIGDGVAGFRVGDAVLGWTDERTSHAELVAVPAEHLIPKPAQISWAVAGCMYIAPMAALAGVQAVATAPGDVVGVSAAAGGVGSLTVQLLRRAGATVIGLAGHDNHEWLRAQGAIPVAYGPGQRERLQTAYPGGLDAFIDTFGGGYVDLAVDLGVKPERINTIIDMEAAHRHGARFEGSAEIGSADNLAMMADLVAAGAIDIPIARTYPIDRVREAYADLNNRHTHGKIVLIP